MYNLEYTNNDAISRINSEDAMLNTEEYLVETADRCIRLAKEGRELLANLEAISNDLMAKAVELDTKRQKTQNLSGNAS